MSGHAASPEPSEDRHEDRGLESRSSGSFGKSVRANPEVSMIVTAIVTVLTTLGASQAVKSQSPAGASSVQIEAVLGEMKTIAGKVDTLAGDVRSLKESDIVARMREVEKFVTKQDQLNAEIRERRADWTDWRKVVDTKLLEAKIYEGKGK